MNQRGPYHPAHALLAQAQPAEQAATYFKEKVQHRPLNLRPTSPDPSSQDARAARRRARLHKNAYQLRKQKPRRLSAKDRRKLGVHDIPKDPQMRRFDLYIPLRQLWWGYMQELLGIIPWKANETGTDAGGVQFVTAIAMGPKLTSADYHGAELEVVRSNCFSRVGTRGIVLKDTKFTFEVVTRSNEIKTIPKKHTVFRFEVPRTDLGPVSTGNENEASQILHEERNSTETGLRPFIFEIHGSQFELRAVDRANRKFKLKPLEEL